MKKELIDFGSRKAVAVFATPPNTANEALSELALPPHQAVLVVVGAANNLDQQIVPVLTQLFQSAIAPSAAAAQAVVVTGGTQAGVMALIGEALASQAAPYSLVGVAPAALVSYPDSSTSTAEAPLEPNHSHFVLVEGATWGSETDTLFQLVQTLMRQTQAADTSTSAGVVVLAGGGGVARTEILHTVRQNLPLVIVEGSGGTADAIAAAWQTRDALSPDSDLAEIVATGTLHFFPLNGSPQALARLLAQLLGAG